MLDESLIGKKINMLTVVGIVKIGKRYLYKCQCECGNYINVRKQHIIKEDILSCGCTRVDLFKKYGFLIGQKINKWTVLDIHRGAKCFEAKCQCECGTIKDVNINNLVKGLSKDCGCGRKQTMSKTKSKNLVGMRFGKLVVIEKMPQSNKFKRHVYRCLCDCGNEIYVDSCCLVTDHTTSCGCQTSQYNFYISQFLKNNSVLFQSEYVVQIQNHNLRFDFYLPHLNSFIEYDGEQHYMPVNFGGWNDEELQANFQKIQDYDQLKNKYCEENNINLLRIPYWEKENIDEIINNHLQRLSRKGFTNAA